MYVMLTPCVFQGGNMMVLKRALLMWYEGHVLPYFWLKCCIVLFCLQAQTEDYQMCQCLFLSFVANFCSFYGLRNCSWRYHTARTLLKKTRCLDLDLWDWKWAGTLDCNRFWEQQGSLYSFWVVFFQAINTFSWIYAYGDKALPSIYKGMEVSKVSLLDYYIHTGL